MDKEKDPLYELNLTTNKEGHSIYHQSGNLDFNPLTNRIYTRDYDKDVVRIINASTLKI